MSYEKFMHVYVCVLMWFYRAELFFVYLVLPFDISMHSFYFANTLL